LKPSYFFKLLPSNCLNWNYYDDHSSLSLNWPITSRLPCLGNLDLWGQV